jgi:hypothetical protein
MVMLALLFATETGLLRQRVMYIGNENSSNSNSKCIHPLRRKFTERTFNDRL